MGLIESILRMPLVCLTGNKREDISLARVNYESEEMKEKMHKHEKTRIFRLTHLYLEEEITVEAGVALLWIF